MEALDFYTAARSWRNACYAGERVFAGKTAHRWRMSDQGMQIDFLSWNGLAKIIATTSSFVIGARSTYSDDSAPWIHPATVTWMVPPSASEEVLITMLLADREFDLS